MSNDLESALRFIECRLSKGEMICLKQAIEKEKEGYILRSEVERVIGELPTPPEYMPEHGLILKSELLAKLKEVK
jgi:hypothetical protein